LILTCVLQIDPEAELALLSRSQDCHIASAASGSVERTLNNPSLPSTVGSGSTNMDFHGESQYSPYTDIDIIGDIDWVGQLEDPLFHSRLN
jgi:hypothetical protein